MFKLNRLRDAFRGLWNRRESIQGNKREKTPRSQRNQFISYEAEACDAEIPGGTETVDENLKKRIKHLGEAINQSLSDSQPIAEAISNIKETGYDVFLVLEATIGFTKQEEDSQAPAMVTANTADPQFQVTAQDMKFLKSLRIRLDDAA